MELVTATPKQLLEEVINKTRTRAYKMKMRARTNIRLIMYFGAQYCAP